MAEKHLSALGRRVRSLREAAGLSQQALAEKAGLSISVITQLEQGTKADPRVSTVVALAKALGSTVDALMAIDLPSTSGMPVAGATPAQDAGSASKVVEDSSRGKKPARGKGSKRKGS